jgi:hypothetical protein
VSQRVLEDSLHPRLQLGTFRRPLNFTVRGQAVLRRVVQLLAGVALAVAYGILFFYATRFAATIGAPPWWVKHFPSAFSGAFVWYTLLHIVTITIIAAPMAFAVRLVYPARGAIPAAIIIGILAALTAQLRLLSQFEYLDGLLRFSVLLDCFAIPGAFLILAYAARGLPSNNRWSGP